MLVKIVKVSCRIAAAAGLVCCLAACQWPWQKREAHQAEVKAEFVRFDRAVDDFVRTGNFSFSQRLSADYPAETRILIENVLHLGSVDAPDAFEQLRHDFSDSALVHLSADVERKFTDLRPYEQQASKALSWLKKQLPDFPLPYLYTQNSALNQSIVVSDTLIGVSLDKYMGRDYPLYARFYTPLQRASMQPERIVPDLLSFYLAALYPPRREARHLRDVMLEAGKLKWVVAQAMHTDVAEACGMSPEAAAWLGQNESRLWQTLADHRLLLSTDRALMRQVNSPLAEEPYFGDERSRGAGLWLGARVVERYMKTHPECSVADLLSRLDNAAIWQATVPNASR